MTGFVRVPVEIARRTGGIATLLPYSPFLPQSRRPELGLRKGAERCRGGDIALKGYGLVILSQRRLAVRKWEAEFRVTTQREDLVSYSLTPLDKVLSRN
jgi:hypothetical protein